MHHILKLLLCVCNCTLFIACFSQQNYIKTTEGKSVLEKNHLIMSCLHSLNKDRTDTLALKVCQCQIEQLDGRFTNEQFAKHTKKGVVNINELIKEDTSFQKSISDCYTNTGKSFQVQADFSRESYIKNCTENLRKVTERKIDVTKLENFCSCQFEMMKTKNFLIKKLRV